MRETPSVTIIGTGAVATALALHMIRKRMIPRAIIGRTSAKAARLGKMVRCRRTGISPELAKDSDLLIFAVPDSEIGDIAQRFFQFHQSRAVVFAHTSGSLSSSAFQRPEALKSRISVVSMHPLQTFVRNSHPNMDSVVFGIEGESRGLRVVRQWVKRLGCKTVKLQEHDKLAYHIAAIVTSNFLVGLQNAAQHLYRSIGISKRQSQLMMRPLTDQTLLNIHNLGTNNALTGPAKRGNITIIEAHERFLRERHPEIAPIYEHMSRYCRLMSKKDTE